jgi:signal transduction histidine kinase
MIGKVRITYSTEGVNTLLTAMKVRYIWLALGVSGISALVFYFISRSLVSPVTQLAQAARKIEKGDVEMRAKPGNLPETRELVLAFNAMLDSLERNRMALEKANQEVVRQKTLAELGKFSLIVAHEVKNPLSIIKSSLDILRRELENPSENTMADYIDDEVKRLNRLIEEFLLFARPASPNMRELDVDKMLKDCIDRFEIQHSGGDLSIELQIEDESFVVEADPDLLSRAVGNVIKNAIEANDGRGRVGVSSWWDPVCWRLEISDEGPGVPDENMDRIFDPFFTTRSKGTGLGLAFVAQVVAAHRGTVQAANRENGAGAVFKISIPRAESGAI